MQTEPVEAKPTPNLRNAIIIPNIIAFVMIGIIKLTEYVGGRLHDSSVFVFSIFVIVPVLIGLTSAYLVRDMQLRTIRYIGLSTINTMIAIALSAIFLREGVICILIVSPLILIFITTGALVGKFIFRRKNNTLNVSIIGALLLIFAADLLSDHEFTAKVSDTMIVNAPVEKVWPLVVEYEPITIKENYWLFKAGMPSPVQSTVDGHEAGAGRKCIFSNGYVFDEKMVVYKPNEELTFDIITQPRDPEIMGHIDIQRGQFILIDNGDGTTTLVGNSWYKLYVFPVVYFDVWAESITRNVHLRVMEHIKTQAERGV
jgi:uncharacterized protein YndB with AHSA1/START domain